MSKIEQEGFSMPGLFEHIFRPEKSVVELGDPVIGAVHFIAQHFEQEGMDIDSRLRLIKTLESADLPKTEEEAEGFRNAVTDLRKRWGLIDQNPPHINPHTSTR